MKSTPNMVTKPVCILGNESTREEITTLYHMCIKYLVPKIVDDMGQNLSTEVDDIHFLI